MKKSFVKDGLIGCNVVSSSSSIHVEVVNQLLTELSSIESGGNETVSIE